MSNIKLYLIKFAVLECGKIGIAEVAAESAKKAQEILQGEGKYNGYKYAMEYPQLVHTTDTFTAEALISELDNPAGDKGDKGDKGDTGKSAYQTAVDSGLFNGTEEEFAEYLGGIKNVTDDATNATENANLSAEQAIQIATNAAIEAKQIANTAAAGAEQATADAEVATEKANEAAYNAEQTTEQANDATANANTAASRANEAGVEAVRIATEAANEATTAANEAGVATEQAKTATANANDAAQRANEEVDKLKAKADTDGYYPEMSVGNYTLSQQNIESTIALGNLNTGGGISTSTSSHLCVDISHLSGTEKIAVKTTNNNQYSSLWALHKAPYNSTVGLVDLVAKGPLCSEAQEAIIDLSLYAEKSPKYLYVSIGAEGNIASATLIEGRKQNIAEKFEEVENKIGQSSVSLNGIYPDMAVGSYTYNLDIPTEIRNGSLNSGGGISASTSLQYLRADLSDIPHDIVLTVKTTNTSSNALLWSLFEKPFEDFSWSAAQRGKGELCSVSQVAEIDLAKYPTANYLYVSIGSPTNTASVTAPTQTKNINERFKEVEIQVPNIVLPSEIEIAVGDTLNLYHKSMVEACDIDNYQVEILSNVGQSFPRYYSFKPSLSQAGSSYTLTLNLKDSKGTIVTSATTSIVVKSVPTTSTSKNILTMGASMVANGNIAYELKRRLTATSGDGTPANPTGLGLSNISFVGRKKADYADVQQEATGGWAWRDYVSQGRQAYRFQVSGVNSINMGDVYVGGGLTFTITEINVTDGVGNIRCTYTGSGSIPTSGNLTRNTGNGDATIAYSSYASETYNPFWNDGKLDIKYYADLYCNGNIDILIAVCGTNDLFTTRPIAEIMEDVKTFARAYHADFPNGKLILSTLPLPSPIGGMGANYNATKDNYCNIALRMFGFAKGIYEMCKDSEFAGWVIDCATLQTFDIDNLYPYTDRPVNNRMPNVKEKIGTNGVHPTIEGYKTIADALYSSVVGLL